MLTRSQAKAHRKELDRQREASYRRQNRAKLAELRKRLRDLRLERRGVLRGIVAQCKVARKELRGRLDELRRTARDELRARVAELKAEARHVCKSAKCAARETFRTPSERAAAELAAERQLQRQVAHLEREAKQKHRSSAKERRQESDGEVKSNLDPSLWSLWEKAKKGIKSSPRRSRTEAFLEYVQENPDHLLDAQMEHAEHHVSAQIAAFEAEQKKLEREMKRKRPRREDLEEAPFLF